MGFEIRAKGKIRLYYGNEETDAVKIAAGNLERDLGKVFPEAEVARTEAVMGQAGAEMAPGSKEGTGERLPSPGQPGESVIVVRTIGRQKAGGEDNCRGEETGAGIDREEPGIAVPHQGKAPSGSPEASMWDEDGRLHKEAYQLRVEDGVLYITGSDRRGTIYGIYELCERLGVSPWYFFADVPVRPRETFSLEEGYCVTDWPSVEYRGIFINDEEELEAWVQNFLGEPTIGVKSYEKIFELLLRLRANYIWPAMHVNSFNLTPENGALAERMGIVVGTSHCDMLMRSNNREWKPWIQRKGYQDAVYDYSIEGRNREILKEYWRESVEQNRDYEVCYTLGMRGIHDSGFETKGLEGKPEEEIRAAKVALLERIIADQREILREVHRKKDAAQGSEASPPLPMMTFIPYKEVLDLYDNGLEIPEDMTLVWANDNYGYIRRYPSEAEKKRKGGNGIYYHNSYWAPPSMSYVFLCSIPLAHTRNELQKAWDEGIRKLWVLNSGAMKPLEQEITFFLRLAWEIGKKGALTEDVEAFVEDWVNRTFPAGKACGGAESLGKEVSRLLNDFSQLTNVRKVENMDYDAFSQTAYGDEAAVRIHRYEELFKRGNALYGELPREERDAFYQLILMRIHAAYFTNLAYYYGDRSTLMYDRGNMQAASLYTKKAREAEDGRRRMLHYYNNVMHGGKWRGILNPEGFPPPRAAMMPVCTPPLKVEGAPSMRVDIWNDGKEICFATPGEKWIEIGNQGTGRFRVRLQAPRWAELSQEQAVVQEERRILIRVRDVTENRAGEILVENLDDGSQKRIPVRIMAPGDMRDGSLGLAAERCRDEGCAAQSGHEAGSVGRAEKDYEAGSADRETETTYAVEEDGLVALEAGRARPSGEFRLIPRLGRMQGSLAESRVRREPEEIGAGQPLVYSFYAFSQGDFLLEIHRFPSLDSVGRLRIGISLDDGPVQVAESLSNDEWRGNWKENVLNNVDRLYLELKGVGPGRHQLSVWAVDRYFAFSRMVIYTQPRKENNLAGIRGPQALPAEWDMAKWCGGFYGSCVLPPRPVYYADMEGDADCLAVACREVRTEKYGEATTPEQYLEQGGRIFAEQDGAIRIDAAAALARSRFAWTEQGQAEADASTMLWRHCGSESYARTGLAMYIRMPKQRWQGSQAPSLNYRICCAGGAYTLWMLSKFNVLEEGFFSVGIDGGRLPGEALYGKGSLWRYEAEQVYRWIPACRLELEAGEHVLAIYALASGMRYDRFYLTRGQERPPVDAEWQKTVADGNGQQGA